MIDADRKTRESSARSIPRIEPASCCPEVNSAEMPGRTTSEHADLFCRFARRSTGRQADALPVLSRQVSGHARKDLHAGDLVAVPHLREIADARQPHAGA